MGKLPIIEYFYSLQGEGFNCGRACFFIRIGGCNVKCKWCDTKESWDLSNAQYLDVAQIVKIVADSGAKNVVITGGEPLIYDLGELCSELKKIGVQIWLETSGTAPLRGEFDWICLSPKRCEIAVDEKVLKCANELKVVIGCEDDFHWAIECASKVTSDCKLFLQPQWELRDEITGKIVEFIKKNPHWQLSLQTHKYLKIK